MAMHSERGSHDTRAEGGFVPPKLAKERDERFGHVGRPLERAHALRLAHVIEVDRVVPLIESHGELKAVEGLAIIVDGRQLCAGDAMNEFEVVHCALVSMETRSEDSRSD